ncbi:MAG: pilin, partial [Patescibacteria group bacterium]
ATQFCTTDKTCAPKAIPGTPFDDAPTCIAQCISGACALNSSTTKHVCSCASDSQCTAEQFCDTVTTKKCEAKKKAGDVCTDKKQCPGKLQCAEKNTGDPTKKCLCSGNGDCPDENYFCVLLGGSPDYKTCLAKKNVGEACLNEDPKSCKSENCHVGTCICNSSADCPKGTAICEVDNNNSNFGKCVAKTPVGSPCTAEAADSCVSSLCSANESGALVCKCSSNAHCPKDTYCEKDGNQLCIAQVAEGKACTSDEQCISGKCDTKTKLCLKSEKKDTGSAGAGGPNKTTLGLPNLLETTNPAEVIGRIVNFFVGIVGTAALIMFCYGGFLWLISRGNEEYITKGKSTMVWAIIGIAFVFASSLIVTKLVNVLVGK